MPFIVTFTYADGSRRGEGARFSFHFISFQRHLSVTKLDIQMFRDESWKSFILGQKVKDQGHESTGVGVCTLASAGFFLVIDYLVN